MARARLFVVPAIIITAVVLLSTTIKTDRGSIAAQAIGQLYKADMQRLDSLLAHYPKYFYDSGYAQRKAMYDQLAFSIKRIECMFAYLHPGLAYRSFIMPPQFEPHESGPPLPDNWLIGGPFGIDPDSTLRTWKKEDSVFSSSFIVRSVRNFRKVIQATDLDADAASLDDAGVFEALRLQMFRISTVGISNGDFVVQQAGVPCLQGEFSAWADMVEIMMGRLPQSAEAIRLKRDMTLKLRAGRKLVNAQTDFNAFDRMHFLTEYVIPLSQYLQKMQLILKIPVRTPFAATNPSVATLYDKDAFNADFFAPGDEARMSEAKAALGKLLFFDPVLSANNQRACASCHKPELAFTDGNVRSLNFERGDLPRNAPTVINAAFQKAQFWDLRTGTLEDQLDSVINSPDEMHSNFDDVITRLSASDEYRKLFAAAFPGIEKEGIQRKHVKIAIAVYERTLTGLNSRFDQYMRGDKSKLTSQEIAGFNTFMGKAKCATCHYAPLFAAALPPYFEYTDHRSIGVPLQDSMKVYQVDIDTGASKVFKTSFTHFSFKVPTVRNAAVTAPYMHNGVFRTLEQVVDFYEDAGGVKFTNDMRPGMKGLPFFMILPEKLNLTKDEKANLVAFMHALTDTTAAANVPKRLPEITGVYSNWNKRVVGGTY